MLERLLLLALLTLPAAHAEEPDRVDRARQALDRGAFGEARDLLVDELIAAPDRPEASLWLGLAEARLGHCAAALDALARFVSLVPPDAPERTAAITEGERCREQVRPLAARIAGAPGSDGRLAHAMAVVDEEMAQGRWRAAAEALDLVLPEYPEDFPPHLRHAYALLRAGDYAAAERAYRAALAILPDSFEAHLGLADALGGRKKNAAMREVTARAVALRPDDAEALRRHAWSLFLAGEHAAAREHYRRALGVAPDDVEAALGDGWSSVKLGDKEAARRSFESVLARDPKSARAREGMAATETPWRLTPSIFFYGHLYRNHPARNFALSPIAGLDALVANRFFLGGRYRYFYLDGQTPPVISPRQAVYGQQHEAYLNLGYIAPRWGLMLHGGYVHDAETSTWPGRNTGSNGGFVGASLRATLWADLLFSGAQSFYGARGDTPMLRQAATDSSTTMVTQVKATLALPVWRHLTLRASFELQYSDGSFYPSGAGEILFHGERWNLGVAGTFGSRFRPVNLETSTIYNVEEKMDGSLRVSGVAPLGSRVSLYAAYEFEHYYISLTTGSEPTSQVHRLTLGAFFHFGS